MRNSNRWLMGIGLALALALAGVVSAGTTDGAGTADPWFAQLEGGWTGQDNETPMGRMPFAMLFEKEADGGYRTHSARNRHTWIDLRFFPVHGTDRWLLEQRASMEGLGQQSSTLTPVEGEGKLRRWVDPRDPDYLSVDVGIEGEELFVQVRVHGRLHAQFDLRRVDGSELEDLRVSMKQAAEQEPSEASIHALANDESVPGAIRSGRQQVAAHPGDAAARMKLAGALIEAIQSDAAMGPRYAGELLETLQTAVALDPTSAEAHRGLAGYYLGAPPIAGGSVDRAEEMARRLLELDPGSGEALMAEVARRRDGDGAP